MRLRMLSAAAVVGGLMGLAGAAHGEGVVLTYSTTLWGEEKVGKLLAPEGVACTEKELWVADTGNSRLVRYAIKDGNVLAGTAVRSDKVLAPTRLQVSSKGEVFVFDRKRRQVARFDAAGKTAVDVPLESVPTSQSMILTTFKLDSHDNLFLLDPALGRVVVVDAAGKFNKEVELPKVAGAFTDLYVDERDTLYVLESVGAVIYSLAKDAKAFVPLTKGLKEAVSFPGYLTGEAGVLWVVDQYGHGVAFVGEDGLYKGRQLGIGWSKGLVYYPAQMARCPGELLAVADRNNDRVQLYHVSR